MSTGKSTEYITRGDFSNFISVDETIQIMIFGRKEINVDSRLGFSKKKKSHRDQANMNQVLCLGFQLNLFLLLILRYQQQYLIFKEEIPSRPRCFWKNKLLRRNWLENWYLHSPEKSAKWTQDLDKGHLVC
ncbi:uncharacterized protein LOC113323592 [Papaver somniferum]|uniref:uncharacterized protein LOC113323592 n=1 Tax=Papaver somniferum TaxID=3469 RepID=UPI000E700F7F|nr:uncharacterized protein LOC113323592 [Papaver somniferum]